MLLIIIMSLSPSRSFASHPDADYYLRKIHRLEGDQQMLQDQLNNTRVRLLRAEEFQLKYEVATKKISKLCIENDSLLKEIRELKVLIDTMRVEMELMSANSPRKQREARGDRRGEREEERDEGGADRSGNQGGEERDQGEGRVDIRRFQSEIESWKQKCKKLERESEERVRFLKEQFQTENIRTHERLTREDDNKVEQLKQELAKYKKLYEQKSHLDDFVREKTERVKVEKEKEISRLKKIIESKEHDLDTKSQESVSELRAVTDKYSAILNMELEKIHKAMDNQDQFFETETKGLRKLLEIKDSQIEDMLENLKKNTEKHMNEREGLKAEIDKLREVLYEVQRENESELYNLKERLTSINMDEVSKMNVQYQNSKNTLSQQIDYSKKLLSKKEEEFKAQIQEMERVCKQLQEKVDQRDHKINELLNKLSSTGNQSSHEVKEMTHSLHNIQLQNQKISAGLNDNIAFKNNQINKLTSSIEMKNIEIKNLYENISLLKKQMGEIQKELEVKWKQERRDREAERDELREQIENLESQWKAKERDWKLREKSYVNDKERFERQILKLKLNRDDLEKVNADLSHQVKEIDYLYKNQIKKGHQGTLDTTSLRRELTHQIEKQKISLELAKKQEVQDLKKKHEIELDRSRFQISNLQTQVNTKTNQIDKLSEELKKLDSNAEKVLKGKFQEYQQKLAALNSEIHLTQNLYNTFMEGKSRVKRGEKA